MWEDTHNSVLSYPYSILYPLAVRSEAADRTDEYLKLLRNELRQELEGAPREYDVLNPKVTTNSGPIIHLLFAIAYEEYDSVNTPL